MFCFHECTMGTTARVISPMFWPYDPRYVEAAIECRQGWRLAKRYLYLLAYNLLRFAVMPSVTRWDMRATQRS